MNTQLRTAPHYFVIDSIGGMNEGYSETTCRRIEDVAAPELAKAMVEEYIDQWTHDRLEYFMERIANDTGRTEVDLVRYDLEECPRGGWVRLTPEFSDSLGTDYDEEDGYHTLFIQAYHPKTLGDGVVVYDQMNDMVHSITRHRHTAMRLAEESISLEAERIKWQLYNEPTAAIASAREYYTNSLCFCYDSLAEVVRDLEYPQDVMVDIDDSCVHYFPMKAMKQMVYTNDNRITTSR